MRELLDRLDALAAEDDLEAVEREALAALRNDPHDADLWRYVAWARFEQGRLRKAIEAADRAGDDLYVAKASFHLWDMAAAADALARLQAEGQDAAAGKDAAAGQDAAVGKDAAAAAEGEDAAEAAWYRGLVAEFSGRDPLAHYRRAEELAPDLFAVPVRLSDGEVDAVLQAAVHTLPADIARTVEETVVEVRPLPRPYPDVDPLSLGLYVGASRLEQSVEESGALPPRIEIYKSNIERLAHDRAEVVDELRITLLHEIGHYLGFEEDALDSLGFG